MESLKVMSYAEIVLAIVPAAPPAWKKLRAVSWPAPISAKVPYFSLSRLMLRALRLVVRSSLFESLLMILLFMDLAKEGQASEFNN